MSERTDRRRDRRITWMTGALRLVAVIGAALAASSCSSMESGMAQERASVAGVPSKSRITKIQIDTVEAPAFDGRQFGTTGQYETLLGRAFGELDPADPHNAVIVNLDHAPRNERGLVEYSADLRIIKPIDLTRGNRTIFYDVPNRGNQRGFNLHQDFAGEYGEYPSKGADLGDGFYMERGYTMVWSGWQGDVTPGENRVTAQLPVAKQPDGSPRRRWITVELPVNAQRRSVAFEGGAMRAYPAVAESMAAAKLFRRAAPHAAPELLPRDSWSFAKCTEAGVSTPSNVDVCRPAGFSPNGLYYLVYEAEEPIVMGIGFAAVRDVVSFLRNDTTDMNPLVSRRGGTGSDRNVIRTAIMFGQSQPGRFVRDFVYQGFNRDASGRMVFEGVIPATAGTRRTFTNFEFASPGRFPRNVEDHFAPGDQFPFTYETLTDPITGRVDGLLARCRLTETCPKVMQFDSANEVWSARGSLVTTDPLGLRDVPIPENVRVYQFAGTQHQAGTGDDPPAGERAGNCQQIPNPAPYREAQRALLVAMHAWVTAGTLPPASQYAKLADGTLVRALPQSAQGFPKIPGVRYTGQPNDLFVNDYMAQPSSHTGAQYTVLVPKVDQDGNDLAGVRGTIIQVPIATYTGWNLRKAGFIENEGCGTNGSYIPFAKKKADRGADPRLSLEERYGSHDRYVAQVRAAAEKLQKEGFLLAQDVERVIKQAEKRDLGLPKAARTESPLSR